MELGYFSPFKPKVGARIPVERTCVTCGQRKPLAEMEYVGPIKGLDRDPARFQCKIHSQNRDDPMTP